MRTIKSYCYAIDYKSEEGTAQFMTFRDKTGQHFHDVPYSWADHTSLYREGKYTYLLLVKHGGEPSIWIAVFKGSIMIGERHIDDGYESPYEQEFVGWFEEVLGSSWENRPKINILKKLVKLGYTTFKERLNGHT